MEMLEQIQQADLNINVYMELPIGKDVPNGGNRDYILNLKKYLYGLKQASANWFETQKKVFNSIDFEQSQVYPCVFNRKYAFLWCMLTTALQFPTIFRILKTW